MSGTSEQFLALISTANSPKDSSTNGFKLNGYDVRRSSALLMNGDILELPSSQRECYTLPGIPGSPAAPSISRVQVHTSTDTMYREDFHFWPNPTNATCAESWVLCCRTLLRWYTWETPENRWLHCDFTQPWKRELCDSPSGYGLPRAPTSRL